MTAKRVDKTNAARLLDRAKIEYSLIPYTVDENDLAATHVARELGEDIAISAAESHIVMIEVVRERS